MAAKPFLGCATGFCSLGSSEPHQLVFCSPYLLFTSQVASCARGGAWQRWVGHLRKALLPSLGKSKRRPVMGW